MKLFLTGVALVSSCFRIVDASAVLFDRQLDTRDALDTANASIAFLEARDLPTGTCNAATPCANGACCGKSNNCGWSKDFCGDGCQHNCDAKPECGPYAPSGSQKCPLNVCCSEYSYCGSTTEFCTWTNDADPVYPKCDTKYGGCGSVNRPSCGNGGSASRRSIGYYESWSNTRSCEKVAPEDLNLAGFTHINFAFAFFDGSSFQITSMDSNAASLYSRFTGLKSKAQGLQTWISVGGWSFTDPGPTQTAFSSMSSSQSNRATFISGLMKFMSTYGFDGVDLDWEYPGADDRGGVKADTANFVSLVSELKAAFGNKYGLSVTLPTSYWYLQHFDLPGMEPHVDWFNLMSYDLHGVWDKQSKFVGPYIAPHTNLTEIDLGLDLLWRSGVTPGKVVLGQGWYGRSFTLASPSCSTPNGACQFSGPANAGPCSNAAGILDNQEIIDIISKNNLKPTWDHDAGVKWITWDSNQWVSYDDDDTFQQKREFANNRCLGGMMVWAMDQVDQSKPNSLGQAAGVTLDQQGDASQLSANQQAGLVCRYTDCGKDCPVGSSEATESNGQPGQLSTNGRCSKGEYRKLCCDAGTTKGTCQWRGYRGAGLSCIGGCADGETEVTTNTNNHDKKKGDQTCNGGLQSYCCAGFKAGPTKNKLVDDAKDAAESAAESAAEQAALDIAAKAFCRIAVPALLAPLELAEDLIPIIGEILDIAEIAATPALIQLCVKGIEKEGKAEFKVFGKKHTLSMDQPKTKPTERPPSSSHDPPRTSDKGNPCASGKKGARLVKRAPCDKTEWVGAATTLYQTAVKPCNGEAYPQACFHYSSAARGRPGWNPVTCSSNARPRNFINPPGTATSKWSTEHNLEWRKWMRRPQGNCQRDEWPPAHFWQGDPGQLIRYNHKEDNTGAGNTWNSFCPEHADERCEPGTENVINPADTGRRGPITTRCKKEVTIRVMSVDFDMEGLPLAQLATAGLAENECYPKQIANYPGFALLNEDPYVIANPAPYDWKKTPADYNLGVGQNPPFPRKRDISPLQESMHLWAESSGANVSYVPADEEEARPVHVPEFLLVSKGEDYDYDVDEDDLGYVTCVDEDCATEVTPISRPSALPHHSDRTSPAHVDAIVTAHEPLATG